MKYKINDPHIKIERHEVRIETCDMCGEAVTSDNREQYVVLAKSCMQNLTRAIEDLMIENEHLKRQILRAGFAPNKGFRTLH